MGPIRPIELRTFFHVLSGMAEVEGLQTIIPILIFTSKVWHCIRETCCNSWCNNSPTNQAFLYGYLFGIMIVNVSVEGINPNDTHFKHVYVKNNEI